MQALANARYGRIGLTVALLAALLAIAAGGGYSASKALLADGAAYAVDGVGLDRLNAATGAPDAEILDLAKGPNRVRVVHRDNQVYLVDTVLAAVTRLDPATLELGASSTGPGKGKSGSIEVVTGGGSTALVDLTKGVLQRVDQVSLVALGPPIKVPGGLTGAVADSKGVLWAASASAGLLLRVDGAGRMTPVPVAPEGASLTVSLVGGSPVVVDIVAGRITGIDPTTLRRTRSASLPTPPAKALLVSGADTPMPNLWALDVAAHNLYRVDLAKGTVDGPVTVGAGQTRWGAPVVQAGRVYVPNQSEHRLVVVDARSLHRVGELTVPGEGPDFDVSVEGGALWANDPTDAKALVVDRKGDSSEVGKGEGKGRLEPVPVPAPGEPVPVAPPVEPPVAAPVLPPVDLTQPPASPATTPAPTGPPSAPSTPAPPAPPADSVVPDLRGMGQAAACAALETVRLTCQAGEEEGGDVAKVSKQDPSPGRTLPPGGAVRITIGKGIEVPAVTGAMRDAACRSVRDARLTCVAQAVTLERGKTRDQVFEQDPVANQRVDEDSAVVVRHWGDPRRLDVPDVTAKTPKDACDALATAGFTCAEQAGTGRPLGRVVSQLPATGKADEGSAVTVTVATRTTMPNVVDGPTTTVCATLTKDLGLPAANCAKAAVDAEENPRDTVKLTAPAAGAEVTLATLVSYVRRTGLVQVPDVAGRSATEACNAMRAAGLGACTQSDAGEGPPGTLGFVASAGGQVPVAGAMVPPGRAADVAVHSAQRIVVPAVGGDIDASCAAITNAGLVCSQVPDNSGSYRQVSGQSPGGGVEVSAGATVTVTYEPSVRQPLWRLRRGTTGTETDTWALTTLPDFRGILVGAGFFEEGPLCNAYSDGEDLPGRVRLVDWLTPDGPGGPVHHSSNTSLTSPPGGSGWKVNHPRAAVVATGGPVTVWLVTRGYGHYFTPSRAEADALRAPPTPNFLAGPFAAFTCWS